jgi:hypothetical protein
MLAGTKKAETLVFIGGSGLSGMSLECMGAIEYRE